MTLLAATALVVLDQVAKVWVQSTFVLGEPGAPLIPGALYLTYVQNRGAAFGMLRGLDLQIGALHIDGTFLLGLLSLAVSVWLSAHLLRHGRQHGAWLRVALTMVLAGAVGNMIDRFRLGYVIDFLHVHIGWFDFPVFNLADALISVGAVLLLVVSLFAPRRDENGSDGQVTTPTGPTRMDAANADGGGPASD